jgi:hypothetical protein
MNTPTLQNTKTNILSAISKILSGNFFIIKNQNTQTEKSYLYNLQSKPTNPFQTIINNRYRLFVLIIVIISTPVLYSSTANSPQTIEVVGFEKITTNPLFSKINKIGFNGGNSIGQLSQNIAKNTSDFSFIRGSSSDSIRFSNIQEIVANEIQNSKTKPISSLVPAPENPQLINFLRYPKYNINVPIQYAGLKDLFQTDSNGQLIKNPDGRYLPIEENVERDGPLGVPVQRLLIEGIVHMGFTPQPGEVGNSYIVGHSSNYSTVNSSYNYIFRPIQERSEVGEEFFVYDKDGRELRFIVFDTLAIKQDDVDEAYKTYDGKRVVTLQCSILENVPGKGLQATKRWLTRGELTL